MTLGEFVVKVKRREGRFHGVLYSLAKSASNLEIPISPKVVRPVYYAREFLKEGRRHLSRLLYYQPLFRSRCEQCGEHLIIDSKMPFIYGNLKLRVGNKVRLNGSAALSASKIFDNPTLAIGDRSYLGFGTVINVAQKVTIGDDVLIADGCIISDNPGHPIEPDRRVSGETADAWQVQPVTIGDRVWLGARVTILPGVTIGNDSVIGTGSVVTKDIPSRSVAVGNPARVVKNVDAASDKNDQT